MTDDLGIPRPRRRTAARSSYLASVPDAGAAPELDEPSQGPRHGIAGTSAGIPDPQVQEGLLLMDLDSATLLTNEITAVRGELARTDAKAGLLLQLASGGAALIIALGAAAARQLPLAAQLGLGLEIALLASAVFILLGVVQPALPRRGQSGYGFCAYAGAADVDELMDLVAAGPTRLSVALMELSTLTQAKYRRVHTAVWLLRAAIVVLVISGALVAR
ncbi:hypothetical protein ACIBHX_46590 [Nonomuraea sp. NPDC050536]|uniref:hypothetical protein n=1 Tax=Nonomuraea sp. NPDC050536 TaxID=3364366 RepID=UPI0037C86C6F